ncbi:hypothetical protein PSCICO_01420 [Pseudomonas cichorii]|uniref:Uncharacterized protein n=2 Tax=Pseudomonas syringae group TaxID=136849 RepID=A0A3M4VR22_PSECI|nr:MULTISPECIES: hypothetical protein [Pseudomonas]AHF67647.1 hypothetical protein PCH70_24940 [Pseudomonas cichorii JBC1]MBX8513927.1 hypothetical protein [Pseudomonas cichorii]MDO7926922.1 hypothetical protein [Pseudomonas sp. KFB-138]QVE19485.1 hypothetical protein KGD89_12450 [Pseudomonas cichorii]RMR53739.1 hypothetical protein ALP84_00646 [Pseudomonas cichorii]
MSSKPPLFNDEIQAWDLYASAALSATIVKAESAEQAVEAAADLADSLLKERAKRIKAAKEHLFQH